MGHAVGKQPAGSEKPEPVQAEPRKVPPIAEIRLDEDRQALLVRLNRIAAHSPQGRYTILGKVASGGMARVLRVWDEDLQRELAMKVIPGEIGPDHQGSERSDHEMLLARFILEARITSQLDHPGIVPVHEISMDREGGVYFTMPLVRGRDLKQILELVHHGEEGWTRERALEVLLKVCDTLAFAHSKNVIHRDLKPANIMVGPFGEAYVMDWGLALLAGKGDAGGVVGTPVYMSPEQAEGRGDDVGPLSDVYSLGAILYEVLSHRMPHEDSWYTRYRKGVEGKVPEKPPKPLLELDASLPAEVVAICEKAMAHEPSERYESVQAMAEDLRARQAGRVVHAYESGSIAEMRKWMVRNRALSFALQALLVLGLVFIWLQHNSMNEVRAERDRAARSEYASNLRAADLSMLMNETGEAKRRLASAQESLRDWEWHHLALRSDTSIHRFAGHEGPVGSVAVSADGRFYATASDDTTVRIWNVGSWALLHTLRGHDKAVDAVAFCTNDSLLVSISEDRKAVLWNVVTGRLEYEWMWNESPSAVGFSPRGASVAFGFDSGMIRIYSVTEKNIIKEFEASENSKFDRVTALAFSSDGHRLYAADEGGRLRCWNPRSGVRILDVKPHFSPITSIALSPDDRSVAAAYDENIWLLDAETLSPRGTLRGHGGQVKAIAFGSDVSVLLSGSSDKTIRVWNVEERVEISRFFGHEGEVTSVALHPDGRQILSGSADDSVRLWNDLANSVRRLRDHDDWVSCLSFDPTGPRVASGSRDQRVVIRDTANSKVIRIVDASAEVTSLAFHPDGSRLAVGLVEKPVRIVDPSTGELIVELEESPRLTHALAYDTDGDYLLARGSGAVLRMWETTSGRCLLRIEDGEELARSIAFHPDSTTFASGTSDGRVQVWSSLTGDLVQTIDVSDAAVTALAYDPEGKLLACGTADRIIALWSLDDQQALRPLEGHERRVTALAFGPTGSRIVSGARDGTVRLWDPRSSELLLTLRGHEDSVTDVAFGPEGRVIGSSSEDRTLRLWKTRSPKGE